MECIVEHVGHGRKVLWCIELTTVAGCADPLCQCWRLPVNLLETAKRNMAESDRLASLGLMSAGIAHELNTPLAVIKGLVEKLHRSVGAGSAFKAGGGGTSPVTPEERPDRK